MYTRLLKNGLEVSFPSREASDAYEIEEIEWLADQRRLVDAAKRLIEEIETNGTPTVRAESWFRKVVAEMADPLPCFTEYGGEEVPRDDYSLRQDLRDACIDLERVTAERDAAIQSRKEAIRAYTELKELTFLDRTGGGVRGVSPPIGIPTPFGVRYNMNEIGKALFPVEPLPSHGLVFYSKEPDTDKE